MDIFEGREIAEALADVVEIVDVTLVMFTPREHSEQRRLLTGNLGSQLVHDASVPVIAIAITDLL